MSVTIDPILRVKPSQALIDFLTELDHQDKPKSLHNITLDSKIDLPDLKWTFDHRSSKARFHELLLGCDMILPEPKTAPRNPELEKRIQKLRAQQEHRDYRRMVENIDTAAKGNMDRLLDDEPIGKQMKEINSYLILIFQFVVSVVTGFAFGFFAPYIFYGTVDIGRRMLFGIIVAFIVGVADMYFIIRSFLEEDGVLNLKEKYKKSM